MKNKLNKNNMVNHKAFVCVFLAGLVFAGCHPDPDADKEKIQKIEFDQNNVRMAIGQELSVKVNATPAEGKKNEQITYTASVEGIIEIKSPSNDGFIISAKDAGILVIIARSENVTNYLEVRVEGGDYIEKNYIMVNTPVIELNEGEIRNIQVNLYGGSVLDNHEFEYSLEEGKDNIKIDTTMNTVVVHGEKRGNQKVVVRHPKADYPGEILVFVKASNEQIRYITSSKNVMMVEVDNQYHHLAVSLFNGTPLDNRNFIFKVIEGEHIAEIAANNEICNIRAKEEGTAVIRVSHPLAVMDFDIRIITFTAATPVIILDKTFVVLDLNANALINASVENPKTVNVLNEFSYELPDDNNAVQVIQTNNQFFVQALKGGVQRLVVSNRQAHYSRETLIVVRTETAYRDDYYITTSQNIIQTQVGDPDTHLSILLVGGVPADANGFRWTIEDGSIAEAYSGHGGIEYVKRSQIQQVFNALAVITPRRAGVTRIVISHPKSEASVAVLVKVYPKNTFAGNPVLVKTEGLLKIPLGSSLTVTADVISGAAAETGPIDWAIVNQQYARVDEDFHGLTNIIYGLNSGQTRLKLSGGNLFNPHEAIVLVGTQEELDTASLIYADNVYQNIAAGQTARLQVKDSRSMYGDSADFTAIVEKPEMLYAVMVKSQLLMQGKSPGESTVTVRHPAAANEIVIKVKVEPANLTIDKPYYITGPEIMGIVKGVMKPITVNFEGAPVSEYGGLIWKADDASVLDIIGNGTSANVTGKINSGQTNLRVSHKKSQNEKVIVVFVAENEEDLMNKIVISVEKNNYLMVKGEQQFVRLITNASDNDKKDIQWNVRYGADVIAVNDNFDSAMLTALNTAGNAEVTINHVKNIIPVSLFVSVVDAKQEAKYIGGPSIIELLTGESKIISVNTANLSSVELGNIQWSIEDTAVASVQGNGESAYILGLKKGVSYVNVRQNQLGYQQRITLLCADTREELESAYVMGAEKTYYRMTAGEEIKIQLNFGSAGFPETERKKIRWIPDVNNAVRIAGSREQLCVINGQDVTREAGNGEQASVIAVNPGKASIIVQSPASSNELVLTIEVAGKLNPKYEFRGYEKTKGILTGQSCDITMKMYSGDTEITSGYSQLSFENEKDSVVEADLAGNLLHITAKSAGQSFITVKHPDAADSARILVYTAATQAELDNYYPIAAEKTNYLIQVGETVQLRLVTDNAKDSVNNNVNEIQWGIVNSSIVETPEFVNKKTVNIKGKYTGDCVFNISFKGKIVDRIYVSVVNNANVDFNKRINTENIIGLVKGTSKTTTIASNLTGTEIASLVWESGNPSLVTVSGSGASAALTAADNVPSNNETYVTVRYGSWLKRHILVYVCGTEDELKAYKAMNMENQYHRLAKNETLVLPVYYAPNKPTAETVWNDKYDNNVVAFNVLENGSKMEITGVNEGVAVLQARNAGRNNDQTPLEVYVEVSGQYANIPREPELKYLTTSKTVYVLNPDEPGVSVELSVTGIGLSPQELQGIKWEKNNNYISIYPNGGKCRILPNGEGETTVTVSHPACNILEIKIIISRNPVIEGMPHIVFDDIVRLGLNEVKNIPVSIAGVSNVDASKYIAASDNGNVEVSRTGNLITLTGKRAGQSKVTIAHPDSGYDKEIVAVVTAAPDGLIYLTTSENFSLIKRNEFKTVKVDLTGFDETDNSKFEWKAAAGSEDIIQLTGYGRQAQIKGLKVGTARIDVNHRFAAGILSLYVRVSETDVIPPYITTAQNIVSVIQGNSMNVQADLVNGRPDEMMLFRWVNETPEILTLNYAGNSGLVQGRNPGTGRIKVWHESCLNSIDIIVIVEKDNSGSGIYITTESTLVEMKPTDASRKINVRLVGGNAEDIYGFKWEIANYNSIERWPDGTSKPVIDITPGADSAYVAAKNEGEAVIRISHPKTSYRLEIKIDVKHNSRIEFSRKELSMNMGDTVSVEVGSPTGGRVIYESSDTSILTVSGTSKICILEGKKDGLVIVSARNPAGTLSDEIVVQVKFVSNVKIRYIETMVSFFTMNTTDLPVTLQASVTGKKDDGSEFQEVDNNYLQWSIAEGAGCVSLFPVTGRNILVTPVQAGNVELQIRHPEIPGYVKRIYILIQVNDAVFKLNNNLIIIQTNEHDALSCSIENVAEKNWEEHVRWENLNPDLIEMIVSGDNKYVYIVGKNTGTAVIRAVYKDISVRTCTVIIEAPKSLSIVSSLNLLPGQIEVIPYEVTPPDSDVLVSMDFYDYVELAQDKEARTLTLKGKENPGFTMISLKANGIEKILTVNTNTNYLFRLVTQGSLRGRPYMGMFNGVQGGPYVLKYEIEPPGDKVAETPQSQGLHNDYATVMVDSAKQTITILPAKAGFFTLEFEAAFYQGNRDYILSVPVYLYYDIINFNFAVDKTRTSRLKNDNKTIYSRIDITQNAVFLADGDVLYLEPNPADLANYIGHDLVIPGNPPPSLTKSNDARLKNMNLDVGINADKVNVRVDSAGLKSSFGYDTLYDSIYAGLLNINYQYSNGDKSPKSFVKTYMLYVERYNRK
ncbi:MAG: hypothetical protein LBU85_09805 [Treponema sp.]|jgi:hypothetical protein|nr:hypothetical protein [Treponema sp.]